MQELELKVQGDLCVRGGGVIAGFYSTLSIRLKFSTMEVMAFANLY